MRMDASSTWQRNFSAPFKWIGGKRRAAPELLKLFPPDIQTYWEPFCGAAAVFFATHKAKLAQRYTISDLDPNLIHALQMIRSHPIRLGRIVQHNMAQNGKLWFYRARDRYCDIADPVEKAGIFLYLLRASFNAKFEIKDGRPTCTINIGDLNRKARVRFKTAGFLEASVALRDASIECRAFQGIHPGPGDLVFADPPYTGSRYRYSTEWDDNHLRGFRQACDLWTDAGARVIVTHIDYPLFRELFDDGYRIENYYAVRFKATRSVKLKIDTDLVAVSE